MRRTLYVGIVGLTIAFAFFYWIGWPSTLGGSAGDSVGFDNAAPNEFLHVGIGPFHVSGRHSIAVSNVRLVDQSVGIELVAVRVSTLGAPGAVTLGSASGSRPDIDALPRAIGAVLRPGDEGFFVVTFKVPSAAVFGFTGLKVTYSSGWLTRSAVLGPRVTVNGPPVTASPSPSPSPTRS